jgi:hypothetical protein
MMPQDVLGRIDTAIHGIEGEMGCVSLDDSWILCYARFGLVLRDGRHSKPFLETFGECIWD